MQNTNAINCLINIEYVSCVKEKPKNKTEYKYVFREVASLFVVAVVVVLEDEMAEITVRYPGKVYGDKEDWNLN